MGCPESIWVTVGPAILLCGSSSGPKTCSLHLSLSHSPHGMGLSSNGGAASPPPGQVTSLGAGAEATSGCHPWLWRQPAGLGGVPGGPRRGLAGGWQEEGGHGRGREAAVSFFFNYPPVCGVCCELPVPSLPFHAPDPEPGTRLLSSGGAAALPPRVKITWAGEGGAGTVGRREEPGAGLGPSHSCSPGPVGAPVPGEPHGSLGVPSGASAHATPMRTEPPGSRRR